MMNYWNEPIQFLARGKRQIATLTPIYIAMDESMRSEFFVPDALLEYANEFGIEAVGLKGSVNLPLEVKPPASFAPMVTASIRDLMTAIRSNPQRAQIYFINEDYTSSAFRKVSLFVCPSEAKLKWVQKSVMRSNSVLKPESAEATAEVIKSFAMKRSNLREVNEIDGESVGLIYMAFGEKACDAVRRSAASLRRIGLKIPVCVVGDTPIAGFQFVKWEGESPFDPNEKKNFQFRAGRIKPKLYELSPFDRTLYLDADTEFMDDILPGFELLGEYDVAIARENLTLHQLYNKMLAGWEINIQERDATIEELGAGPNVFFVNSGVVFFRKSPATKKAMAGWHKAWMEWQQWDEQLAFMRAFHRTPDAKVKILEPIWNFPFRKSDIVIFHNYGRGVVRMNVA